MEAKPLTSEAIALTERKINMTLDQIIDMEKKNKSKGIRPPRQPNKGRGFQNGKASQVNNKVQRYMSSRSSIRQGVLAQRRSNFHGNQFPVTTEYARKAAATPVRNKPANWIKPRVAITSTQRGNVDGRFAAKDQVVAKQRPQTLDALFANMKEQRMKVMSQQASRGNSRQTAQRRPQQQRQGRNGARGGSVRRFGNK